MTQIVLDWRAMISNQLFYCFKKAYIKIQNILSRQNQKLAYDANSIRGNDFELATFTVKSLH